MSRVLLGARDEPSQGERFRARASILGSLFPESAGGLIAGRYRLGASIGAGGLGWVYRAKDHKLKRDVAMKFLRQRDAGPRTADALQHEATVLAQLTHPNVVTIHDVGLGEDALYLTMELIEGESLKEWLHAQGGRGQWAEVLPLMRQAAAGLAAAHTKGVVHRDFKPGNVMVGRDGRVRVVDFGLARDVSTQAIADEDSGPGLGSRGSTQPPVAYTRAAGTRPYMAPEQFRGEASAASDQFALCTSLYEALTGHRPWEGTESRGIAEHADTLGMSVRMQEAGVPKWLRRVVLRGVAQTPADRFADIDALLLAMQPKRRVAAPVAGIAAVALAVGAWGWSARVPDPCVSQGHGADSVLTDARKGALSEAVIEPVARFVDDWNALELSSCREHAQQTLSDRAYELRTQCLSRAFERVDYMLTELTGAAPQGADLAANAAIRISDLGGCGDDEALQIDRPLDGDDAELGRRINSALDQANLHMELGDPSRAYPILSAMHESISEPGRAVQAELWLAMRLGAVLNLRGEHAAAEALVSPALLRSEQSGRWVRQSAALRTELATAIVSQPGRAGEASLLATHAVAALSSRPSDRPLLVNAHSVVATAEEMLGKPDAALAAVERATEILQQHEASGEALWPLFRLQVAGIDCGRARVLQLQGKPDAARKIYEQVLARLDAQEFRGELIARVLNNLALLLRRKDDRRAAALMARAVDIKVSLGLHDGAAQTLINLGNVRGALGQAEAAIEAFDRGLAIVPEADWRTRSTLAFNRALAHQGRRTWALAQADYEMVLRVAQPHLSDADPLIYEATVGLGQVLVERGALGKARSLLGAARALEGPSTDPFAKAELRVALARTLASEDPVTARRLVEDALVFAESTSSEALRDTVAAQLASLSD